MMSDAARHSERRPCGQKPGGEGPRPLLPYEVGHRKETYDALHNSKYIHDWIIRKRKNPEKSALNEENML